MYIRIAELNPLHDKSVIGWAPNSVQLQSLFLHDTRPFSDISAEEVLDVIAEAGLVAEFSDEELAQALALGEDAIDALPLIHTGAVCCFKADSLEEWAANHAGDLYRMTYLNEDGTLSLPSYRVWLVEGREKVIEDFEGVYVTPARAEDITEAALVACTRALSA